LIGVATQLLVAFGISMPVAAPVAASVIDANTMRLIVSRWEDQKT